MIKISIIIPIFNSEKYLNDCINSLYAQKIPDESFEVILINDGSTDRSGEIAESIAKKRNNIVYMCQENKGQAVARNKGLDTARGEFILFVDSDDHLTNNSILPLIKISESENLDMCSFHMNMQQQDGNYIVGNIQPLKYDRIYSGEEAILGKVNWGSVCTILYKRLFIKTNKLRFSTGIAHEDSEFNMRAFYYAKRIKFTNIRAYNYRWNPSSTDRSPEIAKIQKGLFSDLIIAHKAVEFSKSVPMSTNLRKYYQKHSNSLVVSTILSINRSNSNIKETDFITKCYNYLKENKLIPIKGKAMSWKTTILCRIANIYFFFSKQ